MKSCLNIKEWKAVFKIESNLIKKLEDEFGIRTLYGFNNVIDGTHNPFQGSREETIHYEKKEFPFIISLMENVTKKDMRWILLHIKRELKPGMEVIILIQGKRKKHYELIPEYYHVISSKDIDSVIPKKKLYDRDKIHTKLESLIDNIPNLPIQPKSIHGYGSFFRGNEKIGDIDLFIKDDHDNPVWKEFSDFFTIHPEDPHYEQKLEKYYDLRMIVTNEYRREISDSRKRVIPFMKKMQQEEFRQKLKKFNINLDLLRHCTWSELLGREDYLSGFHFSPSLEEIFSKMFLGNTKGIHPNKGLLDVSKFNMVLLWSQEKPSFKENYQKWGENRIEYIKKEYEHFVSDIDSWILNFQEKKKFESPEREDIQAIFDKALMELARLSQTIHSQIFINHSFEEYSHAINKIRSTLKKIILDSDLSVRRIFFNENLIRW